MHLRADLLAEQIDRLEHTLGVEVPIGPAVARRQALHVRGDLMDRAGGVFAHQRAVGAHPRRMTAAGIDEHGTRLQEPTLDDLAGDFVDTVVLADTTLPPRSANAVTGARTNLQTASGTVRAVLTDSTLSSMLTTSTSVDGGVRVAEQRFLDETMLVTEQRPGAGSSVVVAPPRNWNPTDGFGAPWYCCNSPTPRIWK